MKKRQRRIPSCVVCATAYYEFGGANFERKRRGTQQGARPVETPVHAPLREMGDPMRRSQQKQPAPSRFFRRVVLSFLVFGGGVTLQSCVSPDAESVGSNVQALQGDAASDGGTADGTPSDGTPSDATPPDTPDAGPDTSVCTAGFNVIIGTSGDDVLMGTAGSDCILGLGGDDIIHGLGSDDDLYGGDGDDTLYGGEGFDWLFGKDGNDTLHGGTGSADLIVGGNGCDVLIAGGGTGNHLQGLGGDDILEGGDAPSTVDGGDGDDWIAFTSGSPPVDGGPGTDACAGTGCENAAPAYCGAGCAAGESCIGGLCVAAGYCGSGSTCTPSGDDSTCDGVDDDCDSSVDEAFAGSATACGVGVCASTGTLDCTGGATNDTCVSGSATGSDTTCDALDDDCDGSVDEAFVGSATSCGVGVCATTGTATCVAGSVDDSCAPGAATGADTTCDAVDDDCDGSVDEAFASVATSCGAGACAATGATTCSAGVIGDSCTPGSGSGSDDSCDGVDDDCDGSIDEGYVPVATSCGVGVCGASGATSCVAGAVQDSCAAGAPTGADTACDGVDDDCDGSVDESYVGAATTCGVGVCGATGSLACVAGTVLDTCAPAAATGDDSACDGQDNDCDGSVDEAFAPSATSCGAGACGAAGTLTCVAGVPTDSCTPAAGLPDDNCDNVDDDCDGNIDEAYADGNACTTDTCSAGVPSSTPIYGTNLCPADPSSSAPADTGPRFWDDVGFLGDAGGTQRDNLPGAIDPERAAHLFGTVQGANASGTLPLGGVRVSVRGQDDIGVTYSRADGSFDLLMNGGGVYTLRFEADNIEGNSLGYLPLERTLRVGWEEHIAIDPVILTPRDDVSTSVAFGGAQYQLHQATAQVDADGTRTASVLIPPGTNATMVMPDGTTSPLTGATLRATEYTVGEEGPSRMPGTMPAHIAYTYAVEVGFDEAVAAGAASVEFDQPIFFYVDNFLDFPSGIGVPTGSYNAQTSRWDAEEDGVVLDILGVDGAGLALIDADDDGVAESAAELLAFGIEPGELTQLGSNYGAGDSLWRVPMAHTTPWDCNWPFGLEDDATAPDLLVDAEDEDCPGELAGTVVGCDNRTIAEEFPVPGTGRMLRYQSNRADGYRRGHRLRVQIENDALSAPTSRVGTSVHIRVAGRDFDEDDMVIESDPIVPDRRYAIFDWDGLDFAGRRIDRVLRASIEVCHTYSVVFQGNTPSGLSFGQRGGSILVGSNRAAGTADVCTKRTERIGNLGGLSRAQLGGLTLSGQHHLDREALVLHTGSGAARRLPARGALREVTTPGTVFAGVYDVDGALVIATGGALYRRDSAGNFVQFAGGGAQVIDGQLASETRFSGVFGMALGPNGSIFIAEQRRIRRLDADGRIYIVAGTGVLPSGDWTVDDTAAQEGVLARDASIYPTDVTVGDDGTVYYIDQRYGRIRRITDDGRIETLAGGAGAASIYAPFEIVNTAYPGEDAYTNRTATPTSPMGRSISLPWLENGIGVLSDGRVVFRLDTTLVAISRDGRLQALTGGLSYSLNFPAGEPGPDIPVQELGRSGLAAQFLLPRTGRSRDANLFVTRDDGIIFGHRGTAFQLVGGSLMQVAGGLDTMSGRIIVSETPAGELSVMSAGRVFDFGTPFEVHEVTSTALASGDGAMRYIFDDEGRHIETLDNRTGRIRETYDYLADGRLNTITDLDGKLTTFNYAPGEIRIIAPYGETTVVTLDANGLASRVAYLNDPNPGAFAELVYDPAPGRDGLITSVIDRRGQHHNVVLNALGQLESDTLAEMGSSWTLSQTETFQAGTDPGARRRTHVTSALGRTRTFDSAEQRDGRHVRTYTAPNGAMTRTTEQQSGERTRQVESTETVYPSGLTVRANYEPDPQEGWQVPLVSDATMTYPSLASVSVETERDITLLSGSDHILQTDTRRVIRSADGGDRVSESTYERQPDGSGIVTSTSDEGRRSRAYVDINGRVTRSEIIRADGSAVFAPTLRTYDGDGRLTSVSRTDGTTTREQRLHYTDAALPFSATERGYPLAYETAEGEYTRFEWDGLAQLSAAVAPATPGSAGARTELGYDVHGQTTHVHPPGSADHTFGFDGHDSLNSYAPPALPSGATNTSWGSTAERGETDDVVYPGGQGVDLTYHPSTGLLESAEYDSIGTTTYTYRGTGQLQTVTMPQHPLFASGATTEPASSPLTTTITYDGPLVTDVATAGLPGGAHAVHFVYDDGDEMALSSIGVDAEAPIVRTYDNDGILTSAGALTLTPDADSGLINDATAGLVNTTYARNGYGEPSLESHSWAGAGGSGTFGFTYGYDRESRLTQRVETRGVVTETLDYVHDARGRLVDVFVDSGAAATYHYDYDENDNRIGWNTPAGACVPTLALPCVDIDAQDRLLRHDDITFAYNDRGQRISRSQPGGGGTLTTTYEYDEVGNLWRVVLPDTTVVSYRVDGLGRRVARFVDGVADAYWLYQDGLNPVAQLDGAGNVTQQYVYATRLNVPDLIIEGGVTYRVLTDQVGSVRRVVDTATGATVLEREYSPYGAPEFSNGSFGQPFGYAGGLEDSLTGLVRFGARDYDPEVGRWTAKDPILTDGGVNLYEYGASAPQMFVDVDGRLPLFLAVAAMAAVGTFVYSVVSDYVATREVDFAGAAKKALVAGVVMGVLAFILPASVAGAGAGAAGTGATVELGLGSCMVRGGMGGFFGGAADGLRRRAAGEEPEHEPWDGEPGGLSPFQPSWDHGMTERDERR